jgi:uncharacterized membrane protein YdbT with pleckstrin-like domain
MMQINEIRLRPSAIFAFLNAFPFLMAAMICLALGWRFSVLFMLLSFALTAFSCYRFLYIRAIIYLIAPGYIRISRGIVFKRTNEVALFSIKEYVITRPSILQVFRLMNVALIEPGTEEHVIRLDGIPDADIIDVLKERVLAARLANKIYEIG